MIECKTSKTKTAEFLNHVADSLEYRLKKEAGFDFVEVFIEEDDDSDAA